MTTARTRQSTPDLFSSASAQEPSSPSGNQPSSSLVIAKSVNNLFSPRRVLPRDLPTAVKQLDDRELDRLLSVVLDEQKRRRRKQRSEHDESSRKRRDEVAPISLTRGQINAVRAAFKAGVTPSRIARQFMRTAGNYSPSQRKSLADGPHRHENRMRTGVRRVKPFLDEMSYVVPR
jgi:hypothetical protein